MLPRRLWRVKSFRYTRPTTMTPAMFMFFTFLCSIAAGFVGSLLGLGGGIIIVPALTLALGVPIHDAVGASIVSVLATSCGAGAAYVREHLANIRVAMFLEISTTLAAILGAYATGFLPGQYLFILFGCLQLFTAAAMLRHNDATTRGVCEDALADRLRLHGSFYDHRSARQIDYRVCRSGWGFVLSGIAGVISGLLGVGGGIVKVPIMAVGMRLPMKAATATSNFMMGVTAAASAGVYFTRGDINPHIAGPVALGVLTGATIGSKLLRRIASRRLRLAFVSVLLIVAIQMFLKGLQP